MSAGWVAGSTRARLLAGRRVGVDAARAVAGSRSPSDAAGVLGGTRFGGIAAAARDLEQAQRGVAAAFLLELRLLTGWLPPGAGDVMRSLGAWFEMANVEDRLAYLLGEELTTPFTLGGLASAWPRASVAETPAELREALRESAWGEVRAESPDAVHLDLRLAWARRVHASVPEARRWVEGAVAIVVARERFVAGRAIAPDTRSRVVLDLGVAWRDAQTLREFVEAIPERAAWPFAGVSDPRELWRAEVAWWHGVARAGESLVRASREGRAVVVGCVAMLAFDAMRVSAALALAARPTASAKEAFDALA
jgi:hypothetical protein